MKVKKIICFAFNILFILNCYGLGRMGFVTDDHKDLETAENILFCIENKSKEDLKNLFSKKIISSNVLSDECFEKLFTFCDGKITSYEKFALSRKDKIDMGNKAIVYNTIYKFTINDITYMMFYIYSPVNQFNYDDEGVISIRIVKESEREKYFCYWNEFKPGITVCND